MATNQLLKRVDKVRSTAVKSRRYDLAGSGERPTITELWLYRLEYIVQQVIKYAPSIKKQKQDDDEYDTNHLYAHDDVLKTEADVRRASDDVLLEALGLGNVENGGWLLFMVREFSWVELLAANWGLPCLATEYSGAATQNILAAEESERRAQAAIYFLDLMRERGVDPLVELRQRVADYKQEKGLDEAAVIEEMREKDEWAFYVYTCESVVVRPDAKSKGGRIRYDAEQQAQFLGKIRAAARRRRQLAGVQV
jgi:hypothetical protein